MVNLVVQSFGKEYELKRATLAILSFFAHTSIDKMDAQVFLFTDKPEYFKEYLQGLPVKFMLLTPQKVKLMRGKIDFLHRMKIALIEESFLNSEGDLLYFDSDAFFIADPMPLMKKLSPEMSFMHLHEYHFEEMKNFPLPGGATFQAYLKHIEQNSFKLTDGSDFTISPKLSSWNAGVMMLHRTHAIYLPDVYALTEQTYPQTKNHASEQYAFSIVLETRTKLQTCDTVIYHYWYRIKKQIIDEFLKEQFNDGFSKKLLDEKIAIVKKWTEELPKVFENHVLTLRDNAVQKLNENKYGEGYVWAAKAIFKAPLSDGKFIKDVIYHLKRQLKGG